MTDPTDAERESLAIALIDAGLVGYSGLADAVIAAGWRPPAATESVDTEPSEAEVMAAAASLYDTLAKSAMDAARHALRAAAKVREGKT